MALACTGVLQGPHARAEEWGRGAELDDPDEIASLPSVPRYRAVLPTARDLSPAFPPAGDQGKQSSCVAWAVGYGLRSYYHHQRNNTSYADRSTLFSPSYIYNQISQPDAHCSTGSNILKAFRLLVTEGVATLQDFPYDAGNCTRRPDPALRQRASANAIDRFYVVGRRGSIRLDDVKGRIVAGHPVAVGLDVQDSLMTLRAGSIYDAGRPAARSGHAVIVTGYDDRRQAFKVFNSWSSRWAEGGFGWISYASFEKIVDLAVALDDGRGPMPAIEPQVEPQSVVPGPPPQERVADTLAALARRLPCAKLVLSDGDNGPVVVGWVSEPAHLALVDQVIAAAPRGPRITSAVQLRPWPQCEALATLVESATQDRGLQIDTLQHTGGPFEAGSPLVLQIRTPDFPSYLYVTYLPASGDAVPLLRPTGLTPRTVPPRTTVTLGGGEDRRRFTIGPPYGAESVLVIASASPLFTDGLPAAPTEREYLTAMRKTLQYKPDPRQPDRLFDATLLSLVTRARAP